MILVDGHIYIPKGLQSDPRFLMPDEVALQCSKKFQLLQKDKIGIDPMCGAGTIPRVINANGGYCDGIEIDRDQFETSQRELPRHITLVHGDCRAVQVDKLYDYIYTAMPMKLFKDGPDLDEAYAKSFLDMLKPGGILINDTIDVVEREGETWEVAATQIKYLEAHGFRFDESLTFGVRQRQGVCDELYVQLKFTKK